LWYTCQVSQFKFRPYALRANIHDIDRFGSRVDRHKIKAGQLYAVQSLGGCVRCAHFAKPSGSVSVTSFTGFGLGANGGHAQFAAVDQKLLVPVVSLSSTPATRTLTNDNDSPKVCDLSRLPSWLTQVSQYSTLFIVLPMYATSLISTTLV
jgi:hypothetical protein